MGETKNLDQLLKELNEMQMQFDNLKDEMVTKESKQKKNQIKTELASDKIDNDFFKTLATAPKINKNTDLNNQFEEEKEKESTASDNLLFSLDIEHEEITDNKFIDNTFNDDVITVNDDVINELNNPIIKTKAFIEDNSNDSKKEVLEPEIIEEKLTKKEDLLNKEDNINTNIKNIKLKKEIDKTEEKKNIDDKASEKSFLSIKQKLDRIKKEIATRELEIDNKKGSLIQLIPEKKEADIVAEKVLAPKVTSNIERNISKKQNTIETNKTKTPKQNNKTKKRDTVDILTIIILVLLIVLIITAWALLK